VALAFLALAAPLGAQERGTSVLVAGVADAETGAPLEGAEVILLSEHRLARANALGEAVLTGVPRGVHHVRVRLLGYAPAEVDLAFQSDTTGAVFRLPRVAQTMRGVRVEAEWIPPRMRDVEARRRQGLGRFLTDEQLDKERDREFSLVVTSHFPGLTMATGRDGRRRVARLSASATMGGLSTCYVSTYLDDVYLGDEDSDMVRTWDLAAVEYFTGASVPVRYRTRDYGCGVLLLWSKWY
jgi:hypothetical protein